jgi:predicted nuclease with TOPRIM domain
MSWLETLTKETFQMLVREAMKEDMASLRDDLKRDNAALVQVIQFLEKEIKALAERLTRLEEKVDRVQETQVHFANKVGHLEGALEGTLRGIMADFKIEFYEKFRAELPAKTTGSKAPSRKKAKREIA